MEPEILWKMAYYAKISALVDMDATLGAT